MPKVPDYKIIYNWDGAPQGYSEYPQSMEQFLEKTYAVMKNTQVGAHFWSIEEIDFLEAKKGHEEWLEVQFLEEVSGIGDATVEKLLKKFRNADKVFSATAEEIAKAPGISEGRARQIRKKLDDHPKEYGQEYRDKKRKEPFTYRDSRNPGYTYSSESFESTEGKKGD